MIIKRIEIEHGLNPRNLTENTKTGKWKYSNYRYSKYSCRKDKDYYFYKRYIKSLDNYKIEVIK